MPSYTENLIGKNYWSTANKSWETYNILSWNNYVALTTQDLGAMSSVSEPSMDSVTFTTSTLKDMGSLSETTIDIPTFTETVIT
jgi:hypothetical protein